MAGERKLDEPYWSPAEAIQAAVLEPLSVGAMWSVVPCMGNVGSPAGHTNRGHLAVYRTVTPYPD